MATLQAVRFGRSAVVPKVRQFLMRQFYLLMSLLVAGVVVDGFSHTIVAGLLRPAVKPPALLWMHGVVFFAWVGLFILQSVLVRLRKVSVHRFLGWGFAVIGAMIPVLGIAITRVMSRFEIAFLHQDPISESAFLPVPFLDMAFFLVAFGLAIWWRKRPEYHRRLILFAACVLTAAAFARFPLHVPYLSFYSGVDALIMIGVLRDTAVDRRVHAVYAWLLPPYVLLQLGAIFIVVHWPDWWLRIGNAFIG
jgi:hypothetical protein